MSDGPDPYEDDEAWTPDEPSPSPAESEDLTESIPDGVTYYDVLDLQPNEDIEPSQIKEAFRDRILDPEGLVDERAVRARTRLLMEARRELLQNQAEYYQVVNTLGPRLGHHAFIEWRVLGEPEEVRDWIRRHKPENIDFSAFEDNEHR